MEYILQERLYLGCLGSRGCAEENQYLDRQDSIAMFLELAEDSSVKG